ncbi:hypothetical protein DZB84_24325 [Bacillus sp. HNG]|uniref:hypothetical protein n=1 Tax=Bacillus sp. HNG TaxID=2293325 RepID=UPI000E2F1346|nr:hypothetical protein [Bacillus sp. HNG]RFB09452.1 hypothetical protein DZB84_24325 [Bacillus sp. HNG]
MTQIKYILMGILVFVIGFILVGFLSGFTSGNAEFSYYAAISNSLIYLASVIAVCTFLIVNNLKK